MRLPLRPCLTLLLLPAAALVVLASSSACGDDDGGGQQPARGRYENSDLGYAFSFPRAWPDASGLVKLQVAEGNPNLLDNVAVGMVERDTGTLNGVQVSVVKMTREVKPEALEAELLALDDLFARLAAQVAGRQAAPQWGKLGGVTARQYVIQFVYSAAGQQYEVASAQTVTFIGDRQYVVNCQGREKSFDEDVLPGCEQVLSSFKFR